MAETNNQDNKSVEMRSIEELRGYNFLIPSYQMCIDGEVKMEKFRLYWNI
ncbi:hypothetical protein [Brachyspira hampsonii]|nr:hypothetical protein [Brachyspira hampsonii]